MKTTKTIENILDYSMDYEFYKYVHNFEVYFQTRVNTAINKQVFTEYVGKKLNEIGDLNVYFNPLSGDMTICNFENGEHETKKFHEFVSGKVFTIEGDLYDGASNYQLKKDFIENESIKEKLENANVFSISLKDAVTDLYGEENAMKIKYAYLFNTSMFVGRSDNSIENILNRSFKSREDTAVETRNFILLQKGFMNGRFDREEMNPFRLLDDISDLTNVSLKVYYERPINYTGYDAKRGRENGYYLDLAYMDPKIMLFDERTEKPIYKGDSVLIATEIALKKFNNEFHPAASKELPFEEKVTRIAYYEYVINQAEELGDYLLSFTPSNEREEITYDQFDSLIKETRSRYKIAESDLINTVEGANDGDAEKYKDKDVLELDVVYAMLDEIDDLKVDKGYIPKDKLDSLIARANVETYCKEKAFNEQVNNKWDDIANDSSNWAEIVNEKSGQSVGEQLTILGADKEPEVKEEKIKKPKKARKPKENNAQKSEQMSMADMFGDLEI